MKLGIASLVALYGVELPMPVSMIDTLQAAGSGYALIEGRDVAGGFHVVKDKHELFALEAYIRREGMIVHVVDEGLLCTLRGGVTNAHWQAMQVDFTPLDGPPDETPSRFEREVEPG